MTYYHLGNCLALAYGPYYIVYKHFELSEYGAFWKCVQVAGLYLVTELCKMLLLATLFPADLISDTSLLSVFLQCTVDIADLVGLSLVMKKISASGLTKVMIAGLGWSSGDFLLGRALPLWAGARGLQFDWQYLLMSLEANQMLVQHMVMAGLVFAWQRCQRHQQSHVAALAALVFYTPLLAPLLAALTGLQLQGLGLLGVNTVTTLAAAAGCYNLLCRLAL